MPAWWRGKSKSSSKSKSITGSTSTQSKEEEEGSSPEMQKGGEIKKEKAYSFDGVLSAASGGGGKSGDLSPVSRRPSPLFALGHPLPRPSLSSPLSSPLPSPSNDHGSAAASSVSSSGSSDDAPDLGLYRYLAPINTPRGRNMLVGSPRQQHMTEDRYSPVFEHARCSDMPISPRKEFQLYNSDASSNGNAYSHTSPETIFNPRMPNSGSNSRGHPFPTSPRNSRAFGISPGSPTGRQDDMRNPAHPLPLPPSSPSSSSSRSLQSQWKKGKLLGRGTFGHVYLGFNSGSGQMCAIKEVKVISDDSNSKESLKQLSQEITLLSQLSHPNIVQYLGSELDEVTLSVYLEYVSGGSIHKLLQEYGPFTEPVIRSYTAQILSGLAYLHGRNTVHRDIKGANILVDPTGEVKLADFGMAKHISAYNSIRSFKGSPYWMAPEVIMNTAGYNLSVDIWSLGCTILEMATSKPPWSQFEGVAAIFKIGNSKDIPEIPQHLSPEGKGFLKLCLQRDPNARPTAAELMDHPFVRDQTTIKAAKLSVTRDALPSPTDGCRTPISRSMSPLRESDYGTRHIFGIPSASKSPSDLIMINTRANMSLPVSPCSSPWANMSLPVSPCSSPLRNYRQSNKSCVPSPSHPAFSAGAVNYSSNNHKLYPLRPSSNNFRDSWPDVSQQRVPSLIDSPRR